MNEIFADYFISEFDDPLNAYTSSMANYGGAAAAVALAQRQEQVNAAAAAPGSASLPTGGIKTAFHTGQVAATTAVGGIEPAAKKPRAAPSQGHVPPGPQIGAGRGGIAGRLGFSVVGGQVAIPQKPPPPQAPQARHAPGSGVALPVGVGIRLGGIGGVAPATAQASARQGAQFTMWGGPAPGLMTEQAVAERRQRNREHAKRSRVRKKFMLESLQEQVSALQRENVELRMLIQQKIPQHAHKIISECCGKSPLFADPTLEIAPSEAKKETALVRSDFSLIESLTSGQQNFVLSDPRLPDNPIVYASPGFYVLTGYTQDQVLGRNCRFLQGPGTDPRAVDIIRTSIANGSDATTCLLNYKADGTPFWNQFFVAALRDSDNCIVNFVSSC